MLMKKVIESNKEKFGKTRTQRYEDIKPKPPTHEELIMDAFEEEIEIDLFQEAWENLLEK